MNVIMIVTWMAMTNAQAGAGAAFPQIQMQSFRNMQSCKVAAASLRHMVHTDEYRTDGGRTVFQKIKITCVEQR